MTVKDVIRGGDSVVVEERLESETSAPWDRIAARIVRVNDANHFTGALLLFSPEAADELLSGMHGILGEREQSHQSVAEKMGTPDFGKDVETKTMLLKTDPRTFTRIWLTDVLDRASAPMPEVRNADGDELVFSEVRFSIAGEAPEIAIRLDETDEFERGEPDERRWNWYGQGSPSMGPAPTDAITFDTGDDTGRPVLGNIAIGDEAVALRANSQKRADRGRDLLLSSLGGLVGKPLTSHQTVEALLEERGDRPPPNNDPPRSGRANHPCIHGPPLSAAPRRAARLS